MRSEVRLCVGLHEGWDNLRDLGLVQVDLVTSTELMWHVVVVTTSSEMTLCGHLLQTRTIVISRRPSLLLAVRTKLNLFAISLAILDTLLVAQLVGAQLYRREVVGSIPDGVIEIFH